MKVEWLVVGVGVLLAGCGGSSKKPTGSTPTGDCVVGAKFCFANQIRQCAAEGKSSTPIEACDADAACVTHGKIIECRASATNCKAGPMECRDGDVFKCDAVGGVFPARSPARLGWVIFEWTGAQYESKLSEITANDTGSGCFSSSALSFKLEAGKRYLLGVGLGVGEGYIYYDGMPWTRTLSFGNALGNSTGSNAAAYPFEPSTNLYQLRVTTTLP